MKRMDLNCDMGETPEAITDGTQESLLPFLTSVNIACGGHAGDAQMMKSTIEQALRWNLTIGAHPGYPDRANFGRVEMDVPLEAIETTVFEQIQALADIAERDGEIAQPGFDREPGIVERTRHRPLQRCLARLRRRYHERRDLEQERAAPAAETSVHGRPIGHG